MTQLLTYSRGQAFKECRKKHWYQYELGIRSDLDARALRMGTAGHNALEALGQGQGIDVAIARIREQYAITPERIEEYDWQIECETVVRLACGYDWRWQNAGLEYIATELPFQLPLINPDTGRPTPVFNLAGKIDGIVRLPDGRLAVKESKFFGDDISPEAFLWRRLRRDLQVSIYVSAARRLGYAVDCVLYDVVRKPTIKPTDVPLLDGNKLKIVLDGEQQRVFKKDGSPRLTGDAEKGWYVASRKMEVPEWGEKLNDDIASRPDFYYQRQEVPRLDSDIAECDAELWQLQIAIREAQRTGRWFRTVNKSSCQYCCYDPICDRKDIDENSPAPEGFVKVTDLHPELVSSGEIQ